MRERIINEIAVADSMDETTQRTFTLYTGRKRMEEKEIKKD